MTLGMQAIHLNQARQHISATATFVWSHAQGFVSIALSKIGVKFGEIENVVAQFEIPPQPISRGIGDEGAEITWLRVILPLSNGGFQHCLCRNVFTWLRLSARCTGTRLLKIVS
ncbi:hypothetical protein D3C84_929200 [compost metagenome]